MATQITLLALPGIPAVRQGDHLAALIATALQQADLTLQDGDILAVAQKIVSKAEGRLVALDTVSPGEEALGVARVTEKDPRLVQLILQESEGISRMAPGVLVVRHRLGFTSANAGIDRSNVAQEGTAETVLLLPLDPDASAAAIRDYFEQHSGVRIGVVITDSHGRPFRLGTTGVAIGAAGLPALWDRRGEADLYGNPLQHTDIGFADEIASAADLLMGPAAEGLPVVLISGLRLPAQDGVAADLIRPPDKDLYR